MLDKWNPEERTHYLAYGRYVHGADQGTNQFKTGQDEGPRAVPRGDVRDMHHVQRGVRYSSR